jgi:hypothetical protein
MENIQELISAMDDDNYSIQAFKLSCIYKDVCLKNYKYNPRLDICNQVISEWEHSNKEETLTIDRIRQILLHELWEALSEKQNQYLLEHQHYEANDLHFETIQRKIKNISKISFDIQNGVLFKEFMDNYRLGYFN